MCNEIWIGLDTDRTFRFFGSAKVSIGDDCAIGCETMFVTISHDSNHFDRRAGDAVDKSISIGKGVWIASRVALLPGVVVENGCILAAGSVVLGFPRNTSRSCQRCVRSMIKSSRLPKQGSKINLRELSVSEVLCLWPVYFSSFRSDFAQRLSLRASRIYESLMGKGDHRCKSPQLLRATTPPLYSSPPVSRLRRSRGVKS